MSVPRSAKAALQQAEAEGLTLLTADNAAGYKGVYFTSSCKTSVAKAQALPGAGAA